MGDRLRAFECPLDMIDQIVDGDQLVVQSALLHKVVEELML